ncbi:MAG: hypothetical protein MI748_10150 [Opitutales bacterium]|nr:hypothetical protein [Opitutales bacterium]
MSKSLTSFFLLIIIVFKCSGSDALDVDLNIENVSESSKLPKIILSITNESLVDLDIPILGNVPIISIDYWCDQQGVVLVKSEYYKLVMEGFRVIKTTKIKSGSSKTYSIDLKHFVAFAGDNIGSHEWQDEHFDFNKVRMSVCIDINDIDYCSNMIRIY